ncbi:hypothetical protein D3C72_2554440 [compost metagenome]
MNVMNRSLKEIQDMKHEYGDNEQVTALLANDEQKIADAMKYYRWLLRLIEALETGKIYELIPKEE